MSNISEKKRAELESLLQYMSPGTTVEDLLDEDGNDSDEDFTYHEVVSSKQGGGGGTVVKTIDTAQRSANAQAATTSLSKMQPSQHTMQSAVFSKIRMDGMYEKAGGGGGGGGGMGGQRMNQRVLNDLRDATLSSKGAQKSGEIDRSERATTENVMDPRTRLLLYKLVNSNILQEVNGCVSTGKEANVYYAVSGDGSHSAVKVYKTSILAFKDREQYVAGEYRFQRYCKSNPRKMVRTWAEKEARNLTRLVNAAILAPRVKILRQHILVMDFIGEDGWPAPRLKEVKFPTSSSMDRCYLELCVTMRVMYRLCKLVHGDLSEYNLLFFEGRVWVIDVSQSVEHDHPQATHFLRRDIVNVNAFFRSKGHTRLLSLMDLFSFITAPLGPEDTMDAEEIEGGVEEGSEQTAAAATAPTTQKSPWLAPLMAKLKALREEREADAAYRQLDAEQAKVDEQVFLRLDMPQSLNEINENKKVNVELTRFVEERLADPKTNKKDIKTTTTSSSKKPTKKEEEGQQRDVSGESSSGSSSDDEASSSDDDNSNAGDGNPQEGGEEGEARPKTLSEMTKEEKKQHKKDVKLANRERREKKSAKPAKKKTKRVKHK